MNNLQAEFEENYCRPPHEDNDTFVCLALKYKCSKCGKESYYLNNGACGHGIKNCKVMECDCGVQKEMNELFAWLSEKLDAAVKERTEEMYSCVKNILHEHRKRTYSDAEDRETACIKGNAFHIVERTLRLEFLNKPSK